MFSFRSRFIIIFYSLRDYIWFNIVSHKIFLTKDNKISPAATNRCLKYTKCSYIELSSWSYKCVIHKISTSYKVEGIYLPFAIVVLSYTLGYTFSN